MPTTYAHDLFGQKVYRQLPDQVKEIIRKKWGRCITCKSDKRADQERREGKGNVPS